MTVPSSSHDDRSLRTPLARELFTLSAMNALQLERAAAALSQQGGLFATRLVEAGVGAAEVVTALSRVSGLTPAPVASLRVPEAGLAEGLIPRPWLRLMAAPFAKRGETLLVAFANPLAAKLPEAAALPPHEAFVALEVEVRRCLVALFGVEPIVTPPQRPPAPAESPAAAPPLLPPAPTPEPATARPPSEPEPARTSSGETAVDEHPGFAAAKAQAATALHAAPSNDLEATQPPRTTSGETQVHEQPREAEHSDPGVSSGETVIGKPGWGGQEVTDPARAAPASAASPAMADAWGAPSQQVTGQHLSPPDLLPGPTPQPPGVAAPTPAGPGGFSALDAATFEPPPAAADAPSEVGGYSLLRPLFESSLAQAFLAKDGSGPEVSFHWVRPEHAAVPGFAVHLRKLSEQLLNLRHPNIVRLVDFGDAGSRPYFVHERGESGSVVELTQRMGRLPAPLAAELFAQLLAALGFAHGHGLTHGALAPDRMLLSEQGQLRVAGFGEGELAAFLGAAPGRYASPEQRGKRPLDARSDLYAAGLVLLFWLTGQEPARGRPPPLLFELEPAVPALLESVVERLLEESPERRFESATQVLAELRPYLDVQRELYPLMVTACLGNPERMQQQMRKDQAKAYLAEARAMLDGGPGRRSQVALTLYKATLMDPSEPVAQQALTAICQSDRLYFGSSGNAKILELEREVAEQPEATAPLQQLAQLYRTEGNLFRALVSLKKYVRLRPKDVQVAGQLQQLLDPRPVSRAATSRESRVSDPSTSPTLVTERREPVTQRPPPEKKGGGWWLVVAAAVAAAAAAAAAVGKLKGWF